MDDIFARIGVAFGHLLNQSSVNGPQRDEVRRLSEELQTFEGSINNIVNERVAAAVEGIEGRLLAHVDGNFAKLAEVLEAAEIDFQPMPAPLPVVVAPPGDEPPPTPAPAPEPTAPVSTTGNIPAAPDPSEVAAAEAAAAPGLETIAAPDIVEAPAGGTPDVVDPSSLPNKAAVVDAIVAAGGEAPPVESTSRADLEATLHEVQGTSPESLAESQGADTGAGPDTASGAGDTTIMVEGGGSDVVG